MVTVHWWFIEAKILKEYEERQRQREESTYDLGKYYKILELDSSANWKQVKDAYRRLSKKYHPDKNKSPDAESQFKKIQEAYEELGELPKYEEEKRPSWSNPRGWLMIKV